MKPSYELFAGVFIAICSLLFIASVWVLGKERQIFATQSEFSTSFKNVRGLSEGAAVRLGGISVGRVAKIGFSEKLVDPLVYVTLSVNDEYVERLREDSVVSIESHGLLGDKFISISQGASVKRAKAGSVLPSAEPAEIAQALAKAGEVVETTAEIARDVNQVIGDFRAEGLSDLNNLLKNLANISKEIENGSGLIHRAIYSKEDGEQFMQDISRTSRDIRAITREIRGGEGLLHSLIFDKQGGALLTNLSKASAGLAQTAEQVSNIAGQIKNGQGILHDVVYEKSPESFNTLISNLAKTAENLRKVSETIASGGGTLGALLVDSKLYDNLVEVTEDAKRSVILRHAIRTSLEKKEKEDNS